MQRGAIYHKEGRDEIFKIEAGRRVVGRRGVGHSRPGLLQSGDAARGERLYGQQCQNCHTIEKGGKNGLGPNLAGLSGRKARTVEGFAASSAMKASGIVWDDRELTDYLKDPKGRVPGTSMVFNGLKRPEQLADRLAYMQKAAQ